MNKRAIILPGIVEPDDLLDVVARISFYLAPMHDCTITIPSSVEGAEQLTSPAADGGAFRVPEGMDPRIEMLHRDVAPRLETIPVDRMDAVQQAHRAADMVFIRDSESIREQPWAEMHAASRGKRIYPVDPHRDRMEGSQYIQAGFANSPALPVLTDDSHEKFIEFADRLGSYPAAYLLATGPSIDRFVDFDFSDGLVVACNTTVLDEELLAHAKPQILTFADPIFHFGCSLYAAEFRAAVRKAAQKHDFAIVVPIKYYQLYTFLEPSLASRVIGLPFSQRSINLDLRSDFEVKVIDNVATFTMLPLAATFATNIAFLGFDGRRPEESYFWRHNPRTQLNHLMDNIKSIHPGFFDVAYEDYYTRHCENLADYIEHGEAEGKRFFALHESGIPALAERRRTPSFHVRELSRLISYRRPSFRVVSLSPDWVDDFGHYASYDRRLSEAVGELGGELMSVANATLGGTSADMPVIRCFSEHSWAPTRDRQTGDVHLFERELEDFLYAYAEHDPETPTVLAMYVATPWHLAALARLRLKFASLPWSFAPNLFLSHEPLLKADLHPRPQPPMDARVVQVTTEARRRLGMDFFADSVRLQRALHRYTGEWAELWPMFSTSLSTADALALPTSESVEGGPLRVYCPSNAQLAKGYDLLPLLARSTTKRDRRSWRLVTRSVARDNTSPRLRQVAHELEAHTDVLTGVLTDEQYVDTFRAADVILIPYRLLPFASRTSAVLSDAVLLGKPVVATRGTWAGNWVEELGVGATFNDGDVDGMLQAVRLVCQHIDHYRLVAGSVRTPWAQRHSPICLAEVLGSQAATASPVDVNHALLETIRNMTTAVEALASEPRQRGSRATSSSTDFRDSRAPSTGALLHLLRAARASQGSRDLARRLYRYLPPRLKRRVDDLVRSNPG